MNDQELIDSIAASNAAYHALDDMGKRVAISKEVILMVKNRIFVTSFGFGHIRSVHESVEGQLGDYSITAGDLQQIIHKGDFQCAGCAKAAALFAKAKLGNEVVINEDGTLGGDRLEVIFADHVSKEVFGNVCADLIEVLYERWHSSELVKHAIDVPMCKAIDSYIDALPEDRTERLIAIYQNIIDHDGHLVIGEYKW